MLEPEDATMLLDQMQRGDQRALATVLSENYLPLQNWIQRKLDRRLQGRVDAEDILQEAYLAAVQRLKHFNGNNRTSILIWLQLIVEQTLIDVHRRHYKTRGRSVSRELATGTTGPVCVQLAQQISSQPSPYQQATRREAAFQIGHAIESLSCRDQQIIRLRYYMEMTNGETAEELSIQEKAASIRYARALKRLAIILSRRFSLDAL
ncbi:MAG: RNA polymerase sigma-70 factor (ECF subfamily) [Pirellulaceae bacterium]|jgi:RNA polymerase sigma-70 factor (ECF subfamily)